MVYYEEYSTKGSYHVGYGYIIIFLHKHAVRLTTGTLVINIIYFVLLDRLMMAAVQRRTGPYNVGYFGLFPLNLGIFGIVEINLSELVSYYLYQHGS